MAADSENRLREAMGVYFTEPDRRTSGNSVMTKFSLPHPPVLWQGALGRATRDVKYDGTISNLAIIPSRMKVKSSTLTSLDRNICTDRLIYETRAKGGFYLCPQKKTSGSR